MVRRKRGLLLHNLWRTILKSRARFLSLIAISTLGVAFFAGVRATDPDMRMNAEAYYDATHMADMYLVSGTGFSEQDVLDLRALDEVAAVQPGIFLDASLMFGEEIDCNLKLLSMPLAAQSPFFVEKPAIIRMPKMTTEPNPAQWLDKPVVSEGRLPLYDEEIALDSRYARNNGLKVGDPVRLMTASASRNVTLCGIIASSRYIAMERGTSTIGNGQSQAFAYARAELMTQLAPKMPLMANLSPRYTSLALSLAGACDMDSFSEPYKALIKLRKQQFEAFAISRDANWMVFDRAYNPGNLGYADDCARIANIGQAFPLIFFIVAALVSLTTMTRMVEEERTQIGTLKALGYRSIAIMSTYFAYAFLACLIGCLIGCLVGFSLFPTVIFNAYSIMYTLPKMKTPILPALAASASLSAMACTFVATYSVLHQELGAVPAVLMRPRAPKAGKRVLLERIGPLWRRMRFSSKVTARNLFRYKKRFAMSVLGIAGSCALLLTGFGLQDSIYMMMGRQFSQVWRYDMQAYLSSAHEYAELEQRAPQWFGDKNVAQYMPALEQTYTVRKQGGGNDVSATVMAVADGGALPDYIDLSLDKRDVPLTDDGVLVSEKMAQLLSLREGDTARFERGTDVYTARVAGIVQNYMQHWVYMTRPVYEQTFDTEMKTNVVLARLTENTKDARDAVAERLLATGEFAYVSFMDTILKTVTDQMGSISYVVLVMIISAAALAFVVMYNLTNINITERIREMATLRVLGFTDHEMYSYVFRENRLLTLCGIAVGLALGMVLHRYVIMTAEMDMIMFVREIAPISYAYSAALTMIFSVGVNFVMRGKIRKINMVESLKSTE